MQKGFCRWDQVKNLELGDDLDLHRWAQWLSKGPHWGEGADSERRREDRSRERGSERYVLAEMKGGARKPKDAGSL